MHDKTSGSKTRANRYSYAFISLVCLIQVQISNWIVPGSLDLRLPIKGNEAALVKTSPYLIMMMTGNFKLKDVVGHTDNQVVALAAYFTTQCLSPPFVLYS